MSTPLRQNTTDPPGARRPATICALSIDVEEWFHAANLAVPPGYWGGMPSRVEPPVGRILRLLAEHDTRATFFVLGWIADRFPEMLRQIRDAGHEIASHGYWHQPVHQVTAKVFADDLRRSSKAIENAGAGRPVGYRAPSYSIDHRVPWAFDVLQDQGFRYDSSVYPARALHGRYGVANGALRPHRVRPHLWELPLPTLSIMGRRFPAATGGYLRMFPLFVTVWTIEQNIRRNIPVVVNIHPWELDPDQPRICAPLWGKALHYSGLRSTHRKLEYLVRRYDFTTLGNLVTSLDTETVTKEARLPRRLVVPAWDVPLRPQGPTQRVAPRVPAEPGPRDHSHGNR